MQLCVRVRRGGEEVVVLDKPLYDEVAVQDCKTKFFSTKARQHPQTTHPQTLHRQAAAAAAALDNLVLKTALSLSLCSSR